jgi:hypothetical protein
MGSLEGTLRLPDHGFRVRHTTRETLMKSHIVVPAKTVRQEPQQVSRNGQAGTQAHQPLLDPRLRGDDT